MLEETFENTETDDGPADFDTELCALLEPVVSELEHRRKLVPESFRPADKQGPAGAAVAETETLKSRLRGYLNRVEAL